MSSFASKSGMVDIVDFFDEIQQPQSDIAICVIAANDFAEKLLDITRGSIKKYADRCGADYIELTGNQHPDWVLANKYRVNSVAKLYKKTLYLDCDVIIKPFSPNIFEITPDDKISICSDFDRFSKWGDAQWIKIEQEMIVHKILGGSHKNINNGFFTCDQMLNCGVMVIPNGLEDYYKQPSKPYPRRWCFDQNYLTLTLPKNKLNILSSKFNNTTVASTKCEDIVVSHEFWEDFDECYFIHVNGIKNPAQRETLLRQFLDKIEVKIQPARKIEVGKFITNEMLIADSIELSKKIPEVRGVLGIPRSGMIPASIVSTVLSVPLYSLHNGEMVLLSEKSNFGGSRMSRYEDREKLPILVIDDTVYSGAAITATKKILETNYPDQNFIFTAIYHEPTSKIFQGKTIDIVNNDLYFPHILEWNFFNSHPAMFGMFDMDGVFCPDCSPETDENESLYIEWMRNVTPHKDRIIKLFPCLAICTGRLEKYREQTEEWLHKNGIKYNKLIMFPGSKQDRDGGAGHALNVGNFKKQQFENEKKAKYFIESCPYQSSIISHANKEFGWTVSINEKLTYKNGKVL